MFVTGTDTGVGKTVLSAALLAAVAASGSRVRAHKPVVTGLEEPAGEWPPDHELLGALTGMGAEEVAPVRYRPATSPHLAAELAREELEFADLLARARAAMALAGDLGAVIVMEGVGGLLTPLTKGRSVRDLVAEVGLPVLVAARPGLGTINHTLLTLEAARAAELDVRAVVMSPWPPCPSPIELSNRETVARRGRIEVHTLPTVPACTACELARAGDALPWRRWVEPEVAHAGSRASGALAPARTAATSSSSIT